MKKLLLYLALTILIPLFKPELAQAACSFDPTATLSQDVSLNSNDVCTIPSNVTFTIDSATTEQSSTNTSKFSMPGGSLLVSTNAIMQVGSLELTGGTITIQTGSQIKIGSTATPLWVADADADGYAANFTTYTASASGRRRLGLMKSKSVVDCNDALFGHNYLLGTNYNVDADADTYTSGSASANTARCSSSPTWDESTSSSIPSVASVASSFGAGTRRTAASNPLDCNDANASIKAADVTGGTITTSGTDQIHTFTTSGTLTVNCLRSGVATYLVVAGGGSGGKNSIGYGGAGGGGAGGVAYVTNGGLANGSYPVTVGAATGTRSVANFGINGNASSFNGTSTTGGGGGGGGDGTLGGRNGGSGGGGAFNVHSAGTGTNGQGNNGHGGTGNYGGGGGGAGGAGTTGGASSDGKGPGVSYSISGSSVTYARGGGANSTSNAQPGGANTGNGGDGSYAEQGNGRAGGSGVVIVRVSTTSSCVATTVYPDNDGDGYGAGASVQACAQAGLVANNTDCYDNNANAYPGSTYCSTSTRGDGSYDYNCNSAQNTCGTGYYNSTTVYAYYGCGQINCCPTGYTSTGSQMGCGQTGYAQGGSLGFQGHQACYDDGYPAWPGGYQLGSSGTQACQ